MQFRTVVEQCNETTWLNFHQEVYRIYARRKELNPGLCQL